ncbi:TnsA endonuclease N-terminal domain-containing protein [Lutispora sp.]|uniref:TnsA endonuclease N-terminal domain-containing protein n=1 Tax=Lutispora sp. TaxID=2828727 RepID=UPI002B216589|nr:TnsA endonuclease N-terminal domain-containing protein [Lutispora sp.]MEA4961581.1 TnsA endonuclease N-terminal domain-containing protein [Lutispora sp.]
MAKRKYGIDEDKIQKYMKEGRGQGVGRDYKPWINIHDFPSQGRVSRCFGWKTGRIHHFLSDSETRYFYLLEWSDCIIDIREQYPILDRDRTQKIAEEKGIKYPEDVATKTPLILTTDFLITVRKDGKNFNVARTIKPSRDLEKPRTIEKFEIEKTYWEEQDIDWSIVTEKEISREFASNVEWVHDSYKLETTTDLDMSSLMKLTDILKERLSSNSTILLKNLLHDLDTEFNYNNGFFLYLLKHLVATKQVMINCMDRKFNINQPVGDLLLINSNSAVLEKEKIAQ